MRGLSWTFPDCDMSSVKSAMLLLALPSISPSCPPSLRVQGALVPPTSCHLVKRSAFFDGDSIQAQRRKERRPVGNLHKSHDPPSRVRLALALPPAARQQQEEEISNQAAGAPMQAQGRSGQESGKCLIWFCLSYCRFVEFSPRLVMTFSPRFYRACFAVGVRMACRDTSLFAKFVMIVIGRSVYEGRL